MNWKRILNMTVWIALGIALVMVVGFTERENRALRCSRVDIEMSSDENESFITYARVSRLVGGDSLPSVFINKPVSSFRPGEIEGRIEQNPYVRNAEVFIDIDGSMRVEVEQRKPVIRIFRQNSSGYYIDGEGLKMPLSTEYTENILVATGYIIETYDGKDSLRTQVTRDLFTLAKYIGEHEFWKTQIVQVHVEKDGELILFPNVGDHKIILGDVSGLDEKLKKLWLFYHKALPKVGWDRYKVINLKYTGQIVCEK